MGNRGSKNAVKESYDDTLSLPKPTARTHTRADKCFSLQDPLLQLTALDCASEGQSASLRQTLQLTTSGPSSHSFGPATTRVTQAVGLSDVISAQCKGAKSIITAECNAKSQAGRLLSAKHRRSRGFRIGHLQRDRKKRSSCVMRQAAVKFAKCQTSSGNSVLPRPGFCSWRNQRLLQVQREYQELVAKANEEERQLDDLVRRVSALVDGRRQPAFMPKKAPASAA